MNDINFNIVRYTSDKFNQIYKLFLDVFKANSNFDVLKKIFGTEYTQKEAIGFMAYHNEKLAAYYGVFPYLIKFKQKEYLVSQSGATMTHQDYQGKGLFTKLAKLSYETAKNEGSNLVFGFPNKNSYHGFVTKLNWKHENDLSIFSIKINTIPLLKIATVSKLFKPFYLFWVNLLIGSKKTDEILENSLIDEKNGGVVHNSKYFKLKESNDKFLLKINNKKVWVKFDGSMWIGDFERCSLLEFKSIIHKLKTIAFLTGSSKIVYITSEKSFWFNMFSEIMQPEKHYPIGYLDFTNEIPIDKIMFSGSDFDTW